MANLSGGDLITTVRLFMAEPSSSGRFSDEELYSYINLAQTQVMLEVEWPEATIVWTSDGVHCAPYQELQLPEMTSFLRCYNAGQICVPTSIPLLEGDQMQYFDQNTPTYQPNWMTMPFTGYPVACQASYPNSNAVPSFKGQRPSYYLDRGGALGIVPPPVVNTKVAIDYYPVPLLVSQATDQTYFPQMFREGLAWRACMYAYFAGGVDTGDASTQLAAQNWVEQKRSLLTWKEKFNRNLPNQPVVVPHRTYTQGPYRGPTSGSRFGG